MLDVNPGVVSHRLGLPSDSFPKTEYRYSKHPYMNVRAGEWVEAEDCACLTPVKAKNLENRGFPEQNDPIRATPASPPLSPHPQTDKNWTKIAIPKKIPRASAGNWYGQAGYHNLAFSVRH
jgi:hypothetical protein